MAKLESEEIVLLLKSISDKADATKDAVSQLDKKLDLHIQKTDYRFEMIEKLDAEQNELLAKHAQRSEELKRDNDLKERQLRAEILGEGSQSPEKSLKGRVEVLEAPHKWWKFTMKLMAAMAALAGTAGTIKAILSLLGK